MASLNQLLLSFLRFLSFISIAALAYTRKSADVGNRLQGQHSITAWKSQTSDGFLFCRIFGPTVLSPSALFTAVGDSSSSEKFPESNELMTDSKYPDKSPLKYSDFHVVTRTQSNDEIRHLELYLKWRKGGEPLNTVFYLR